MALKGIGRGAGLQGLLLACVMTVTLPGAARAQDIFDFFSNAFGGAASRPLPQPDDGYYDAPAPSLTVRPKPRRHRALQGTGGGRRYNTADLKGVTIYNDKTLARGDAVMTTSGLKVFTGTPGAIHTEEDFLAVAENGRLTTSVRNQLIAIDNASRPGLAR